MSEFDYFNQCAEFSDELQAIKRRFIKHSRSLEQADAVSFAADLLALQDDLHSVLAAR